MDGTCKLCRNNGILEESHFIPKFVGKWLKRTSITGYLRQSDEVKKRRQDIEKEYWLCGDCEDLFSVWETKFANQVFFPVVDKGLSVIEYGEWMGKLCASLSWRTLTYIRSKNYNENEDENYANSINTAERHLAKYLLGEEKTVGIYEQHLFPLGEIAATTDTGLPKNINRFFLRSIGMDIVGNYNGTFIYTKLPSFILLGLVSHNRIERMRSSRISMKKGKISPRKYHWPKGFINYIVEKANQITDSYDKIPDEHKQKFEEFIQNNPDKAANSKLFKAFLADYEMFGKDVFR